MCKKILLILFLVFASFSSCFAEPTGIYMGKNLYIYPETIFKDKENNLVYYVFDDFLTGWFVRPDVNGQKYSRVRQEIALNCDNSNYSIKKSIYYFYYGGIYKAIAQETDNDYLKHFKKANASSERERINNYVCTFIKEQENEKIEIKDNYNK